jgi:hypothetical protein
MVQAVRRRPLNVEARFRSRRVYFRCVVGKMTQERDVVRVLIRRTSGQNLRTFFSFRCRETLDRKTFTFVVAFKG